MSFQNTKQLSPFEIKSTINILLKKINSPQDIQNCLEDFEMFDSLEDKSVLTKLLFKELSSLKNQDKIPVICFLLERYVEKDELIAKFWDLLKNTNLQSEVKIMILNILRELDSDWSFENNEDIIKENPEILDENTKQLLNSAVINPEVQIDFMDFMATISVQDKITLLNSLANDFSEDILANILVPVFESEPNSPQGKEALKLLSGTKSQLALHTLEEMSKFAKGELSQEIRRSLAILKMSGMRVDNTKEFYKKILSDTVADQFYVTYPDAHSDVAMIFTRKTPEGRIRFVSIVINLDKGIRDCFGFFEISQFECDKILERFLKDERTASVSPSVFKTILANAEFTTKNNSQNWVLPYEYVCWKNLLVDIDYDENYIEQILKEKLHRESVDESVFQEIDKMKISVRWFLDSNYSDEFNSLLKDLKTESNLDSLVSDYKNQVFDEYEKISWKKKLLYSAYIKYSIGKEDEALKIYSLMNNENILDKFLENILRRSIYEYLTLIKYDKTMNVFDFEQDIIDEKLEYIELNWIGDFDV